jgi:hypothetical protein
MIATAIPETARKQSAANTIDLSIGAPSRNDIARKSR